MQQCWHWVPLMDLVVVQRNNSSQLTQDESPYFRRVAGRPQDVATQGVAVIYFRL